MPSMLIRAMAEVDAGAVAALSGELGYPAAQRDVAERWKALAGRNDHAMFVADENGRIAGWLHVHDDWTLEAGHMKVHEAQNTGWRPYVPLTRPLQASSNVTPSMGVTRSTRFGATPSWTMAPGFEKSLSVRPTSPNPKSASASSSCRTLAEAGSTKRSMSFVNLGLAWNARATNRSSGSTCSRSDSDGFTGLTGFTEFTGFTGFAGFTGCRALVSSTLDRPGT